MSATLTKTRPGGAREAQTASVELPEAVNPAKKRLAEMLTAYDKATLDLADARSHLARAESDEAAALDSSGDDADDRIAVAIRSKAIYTARVTNREASQAKQAAELSKSDQRSYQRTPRPGPRRDHAQGGYHWRSSDRGAASWQRR